MTNEQREKITALRHQGFGYTAIANSVGLSKDSVKAYCRTHGLAGEKAESHTLAAVPTQLCQNCSKMLVQLPGRKTKKFCSPECRTAWWNAHPEAVKQKLVIVPEEAEVIRWMYAEYMKGASRIEIGRMLMDRGIYTRQGKPWVDSNVKVILTNITYTGNMLFQKEYCEDPITKHRKKNRGELPQYYVENTHEAIIPKDEWDAVQEEFKRRKELGPFGNKSLNTCCFTGKIKCPHCGVSYMHNRRRDRGNELELHLLQVSLFLLCRVRH